MWEEKENGSTIHTVCVSSSSSSKGICLTSGPNVVLATLPTGLKIRTFFYSFPRNSLCLKHSLHIVHQCIYLVTVISFISIISLKNCFQQHHDANRCFSQEKCRQELEVFWAMMNRSPADVRGDAKVGPNHATSESVMAYSAFAWWRHFCSPMKYSQVDSSAERCGGSVRFSVQSCSRHMANGHLRGI